jgi:hypothetical protein
MGHLTREEMEAVIRSGGGVKVGGRVRTRIEDLPTAAELAQGDPAKEAAAAEDLQAQIAALQAQVDQLATAPKRSASRSGATPPTEKD